MGRILLDIPIRVMEFRETIFSLFIPIVVMISIFLAALNFKEKNKIVLVLSLIILILLSTIGQAQWLEGFRYGK
jgi:Ca2+/H+ antiporter